MHILVRNMDPELHKRLKARAAARGEKIGSLDVALMGAQERACLVVPQRARTDPVSSV